jgi:hypothetical protein
VQKKKGGLEAPLFIWILVVGVLFAFFDSIDGGGYDGGQEQKNPGNSKESLDGAVGHVGDQCAYNMKHGVFLPTLRRIFSINSRFS